MDSSDSSDSHGEEFLDVEFTIVERELFASRAKLEKVLEKKKKNLNKIEKKKKELEKNEIFLKKKRRFEEEKKNFKEGADAFYRSALRTNPFFGLETALLSRAETMKELEEGLEKEQEMELEELELVKKIKKKEEKEKKIEEEEEKIKKKLNYLKEYLDELQIKKLKYNNLIIISKK